MLIKNYRITVICSLLLYFNWSLFAQQPTSRERQISGLIQFIEENKRTTTELSNQNLTCLPIGISKTFGSDHTIIAIDSAKAVPQGFIINVCTRILLPSTNKYIYFEGKNILITPAGLAATNSTRLVMLTRFEIPINDQVKLILPADGNNYIEWDCNGFKSINLKGLFEFNSSTFTPDPILAKGSSKVTATVEIHASNLSDIIVGTSITPFRIKGLSDMAFSIKEAYVDFSDLSNAPGFTIPAGYDYSYADMPSLWRGFYMKKLTVYLPSEISKPNKRDSVEVMDMLLDDSGISGTFRANDIVDISSGEATGWPFSVKTLSFTLTQNQLTNGSIAGAIGIPFLGGDTMSYTAQVLSTDNGIQYYFDVAINDTAQYNLPFGGNLILNKGCSVSIQGGNGKFVASALLNGTINLQNDLVKANGITFENLLLTTESPYIQGGTFSSAGSVGFKISGFEFGVSDIVVGIYSGRISLGFTASIDLMREGEKGISADARFEVSAKMEDAKNALGESTGQRWVYDGTEVQYVFVDATVSVFKLMGGIDIYRNDPKYGDGFKGNVTLRIDKLIPEPITVEARFGTVTGLKYWFVRVDVPTTIPMGIFEINRLSGGAYNHMKRDNLQTFSSTYSPDTTAGMGFLAGAGLIIKNEKFANADVMFEIAFNRYGGLRYVMFQGQARFFSANTASGTPPVSANLSILFDNENDIFHANFQVYMNIANVMKGIGPNNLLGEAVIHSDPHDWYVFFGRPSQQMGIDVAGLLQVQGYFMAGTQIEDLPLPPSEVASILGGVDMDFMKKENAIATGNGIGFGMSFKVGFGFGRNGGFVYAYLDAGAGVDVMMRDYGDATCQGRSGTIGINGWYASGQAYAYLQGRIGIRVRHHEYDIMSVAAAMLLQAKLPNPSWFRGIIAARYRLLGGLVRGSVKVTVVLGDECEIVTNGSELVDIKLIAEMQPAKNSTGVDIFTIPQVAFNSSIDKEFGMTNLNDEYNVYRVKLDEYYLRDASNNKITSTTELNDAKDLAVLRMRDILPGNKALTAVVKVHIEKKERTGWVPLKLNGAIDYDTEEAGFTTGEEPTSIPENNVSYSYPIRNQFNFYHNEYNKGYIKLTRGQPGLFAPATDGKTWNFLARFSTNTGVSVESPASYNEQDATVNFDIPTGIINGQMYTLHIVKTPASGGTIDRNMQRTENIVNTTSEGDSTAVASNKLTGAIESAAETNLHTLAFRSSLYNTFTEKLNALTGWTPQYNVDETLMSLLGVEATTNELFDDYELAGSGTDVAPLVFPEAQRGNAWIDQHVYPQVYELYGKDGLLLDRNTSNLGIFPSKGMRVFNFGFTNFVLTASDKAQNAIPGKSGNFAIRYYIPHYVYVDFAELRNKAASKYLGSASSAVPESARRLLAGTINDIYHGSYPFSVNYRLPGKNIVTSSKNYSINF